MTWLNVAVVTMTAVGTYQQGKAQKDAAKDESRQLQVQATRREKEGVMDAAEERRKNRILLGDARAALAASGGTLTGPQALLQQGDIAGASKFNELSYLYEAKLDADAMRKGARTVERSGRAAARTTYARGVTSVLTSSAFGKLYGDYGDWAAKRKAPSSTGAPVVTSTPSWSRGP